MPVCFTLPQHVLTRALLVAVFASCTFSTAQAATAETGPDIAASADSASENLEPCLQSLVLTAAAEVTIAELRNRCRQQWQAELRAKQGLAVVEDEEGDALQRRKQLEKVASFNPFSILAHRPNYILPVTYNNTPNDIPFRALGQNALGDEGIDRWESKFQLSLKIPVAKGLLWGYGDLFFAYTNTSWWQTANTEASRPFRETNHEPETWLEFAPDIAFGNFTSSLVRFGISHESNGRSTRLSRSWNRLYLDFIFEHENLVFAFKPWYRFQEKPKDGPNDPKGDDNPNIERFAGQARFIVAYRKNNQTWTANIHNNLRHENRSGIKLSWSRSFNRRVSGYVQYFTGYGESLLDYDEYTNRLGIGILISDWL